MLGVDNVHKYKCQQPNTGTLLCALVTTPVELVLFVHVYTLAVGSYSWQ